MTKFSTSYSPEFKPEDGGVKSFRGWKQMQGKVIDALFNCQPHEYVSGIVVDETGITATIEIKK